MARSQRDKDRIPPSTGQLPAGLTDMDNEEIKKLLQELKESSDESTAVRSRIVKIHFDTPAEAEHRKRVKKKAEEAEARKRKEEEARAAEEEEARRLEAEQAALEAVEEAKREAKAGFSSDLESDILSEPAASAEEETSTGLDDLDLNWDYEKPSLKSGFAKDEDFDIGGAKHTEADNGKGSEGEAQTDRSSGTGSASGSEAGAESGEKRPVEDSAAEDGGDDFESDEDEFRSEEERESITGLPGLFGAISDRVLSFAGGIRKSVKDDLKKAAGSQDDPEAEPQDKKTDEQDVSSEDSAKEHLAGTADNSKEMHELPSYWDEGPGSGTGLDQEKTGTTASGRSDAAENMDRAASYDGRNSAESRAGIPDQKKGSGFSAGSAGSEDSQGDIEAPDSGSLHEFPSDKPGSSTGKREYGPDEEWKRRMEEPPKRKSFLEKLKSERVKRGGSSFPKKDKKEQKEQKEKRGLFGKNKKQNDALTDPASQGEPLQSDVTQSVAAVDGVSQDTASTGDLSQSTAAVDGVSQNTVSTGDLSQSTAAVDGVSQSTASAGDVSQSTAAVGGMSQSTGSVSTSAQSAGARDEVSAGAGTQGEETLIEGLQSTEPLTEEQQSETSGTEKQTSGTEKPKKAKRDWKFWNRNKDKASKRKKLTKDGEGFESGRPEGETTAAGVHDGETTAAGVHDGETTSTGVQDAGIPTTGVQDGGMPSTGVQDNGMPAAGMSASDIGGNGLPGTGKAVNGTPGAAVPDMGAPGGRNLKILHNLKGMQKELEAMSQEASREQNLKSIEVINLNENQNNMDAEIIPLEGNTGPLPDPEALKKKRIEADASEKKKKGSGKNRGRNKGKAPAADGQESGAGAVKAFFAGHKKQCLIGAAAALVLILLIVFIVIALNNMANTRNTNIEADEGLSVSIVNQPKEYAKEGDVEIKVSAPETIQSITVNGENVVIEQGRSVDFTYHASGGTLDIMAVSTDKVRNAKVILAYVDSEPPVITIREEDGKIALSAEDTESGLAGLYIGTLNGLSDIPQYAEYTEPLEKDPNKEISYYAKDLAGNSTVPAVVALTPAESISFKQEKYELFPGAVTPVTLVTVPEHAFVNNLELEAENPKVVQIEGGTQLRGIAEGDTKITATADGIAGVMASVTVSEKRKVTISAVGDCTLGTDVNFSQNNSFAAYEALYGDSYFFEKVKGILSSDDSTFANFEGTLTTSDVRGDKIYAFKGDPSYTQILLDGSIDVVTLANNHCDDYGDVGEADTQNALDSAGIEWCKDDKIAYRDLNGVKTAYIGIYALENGLDTLPQVKSTIAEAKEEGAQLIIIEFHWGAELVTEIDEYQKELAHAAVDAGANLVLGSHAHVLQGIEKYNGVYIVYGLANFCFGGNANPTSYDTMIWQQTFTFTADGLESEDDIAIIPCQVSGDLSSNNYQPVPVSGDTARVIMQEIDELSSVFGQSYSQYMVDGTLWTAESSEG